MNPYSDRIDNPELKRQCIILIDFNLVEKYEDVLVDFTGALIGNKQIYFIVDYRLSLDEVGRILSDLDIKSDTVLHNSIPINYEKIQVVVGETAEFLSPYKELGVETLLMDWKA